MANIKHYSYSKPPLTRVSISLVLNDLAGVKQTDLSHVADRLVDLGYPIVGEERPQFSFTEPVDVYGPATIDNLDQGLPPLRGIILSTRGAEWHVRFQDSRVSVEWSQQVEPYPRFSEVKNRFLEAVNVFEKSLDERGFSMRSLKQIEIAYINQVTASELHEMLDFVKPVSNLDSIEGAKFIPLWESLRYAYELSQSVTKVARIYFDCYPLKDKQLVTRIAFFARLDNSEASHLDAVAELGHNAINQFFDRATLDDLQIAEWGKEI